MQTLLDLLSSLNSQLATLDPSLVTHGVPVVMYFFGLALAVVLIGLIAALLYGTATPLLISLLIACAVVGSALITHVPVAGFVAFGSAALELLVISMRDDEHVCPVILDEPPAPTPSPIPMGPLPSAPPAAAKV